MEGLLQFIFFCILTLAILCFFTYNKVIPLLESCKSREANINTELKRKLDVYFKFSEMLQSGSAFEKSVFLEITKLRTDTSLTLDEKIDNARNLLSVAESNPNVNSIDIYKIYQHQIAETETRVQNSRELFNDAVNEYNSIVKLFPTNIVCKILRFAPYSYSSN